ncbi:MAG: PAS domain S-box protein [Granulosicoccaceae bacterium]
MLNNRLVQLLLGALLTIALVGLLPSLMLWLDLNAFEKQQLRHVLEPRLPLMLILAGVGLVVPVLFFGRFYQRHLHSLARVNRRLREALEADGQALALDSDLSPEEHTLLSNTNALMASVQQRRSILDRELSDSTATRARERVRLTALLNQISQGVMVCNLEGRILLANGIARSLLGKSTDHQAAQSALGESIFALLDAELIAHALTIVRERLQSGTRAPHTTLSAMSRNGRMVRVRLATAVNPEDDQIEGFVLALDDIEAQHSQGNQRDKLLHGLNRETRNLLTRLRTGIDSLQRDPSAARHQRSLLTALGRDTARHCDHLERLSFQRADQLAHTWPLEPILARDLLRAVQQQLHSQHQMAPPIDTVPEAGLWLEADSFSLAKAIANCMAALQADWEMDKLGLNAETDRRHGLLLIDLYWGEGVLRQEDFRSLATSTRQSVAVGGRALVELIERHAGRAWLEDPKSNGQRLRIALPLSEAPTGAEFEVPNSKFDFSPKADTSASDKEPLLQHQYFTVLAVGSERLSAADMARAESTLVALLLAGGKPQALAQKQLKHSTLSPQQQEQGPSALSEFSRNGAFITHDANLLMGQLGAADRQLISQAGLLDTAAIAALLFPEDTTYSLYRVASRLGIETDIDDTTDQVKLIARVFNRMLTRLHSQGIRSLPKLQKALSEQQKASA